MSSDLNRDRSARDALIIVIEASGGIFDFGDGTSGPVAAPGWLDLTDAYRLACLEAGRIPDTVSGALQELH